MWLLDNLNLMTAVHRYLHRVSQSEGALLEVRWVTLGAVILPSSQFPWHGDR